MARKYDSQIYRQVCTKLDGLFEAHGDPVQTCVNRYLRIRTETRVKERRIAELKAELEDLQKVDSISRRKSSG